MEKSDQENLFVAGFMKDITAQLSTGIEAIAPTIKSILNIKKSGSRGDKKKS